MKTWSWKIILLSLSALLICFSGSAAGKLMEYNLTLRYEEVNFTGNPAKAMTVNGSVPGPVLTFHEGDVARIQVHNLMDVDTSIHWHGILVPPAMDGVPYVSFPPIAPSRTFTYDFPIRQSGTYWYHSHSSLQEQRGVYGGIVILPKDNQDSRADREYVLVLSDWTDEDPHSVLRTLKRGSEWYAIAKGSGQSLFGAARLGMMGDYFKRELLRMPPMDIADVAYDRFWVNGQSKLNLEAEPGEILRLRIIDGSSTTNFHLEFAGGAMELVAADGLEIKPVKEKRFLISVAETYDVLIRIPDSGAYELRATAHDGSGAASVILGEGMMHAAPDVPLPNLYHTMGKLDLKTIFALTPAAGMGMADAMVEEGMFDQPGGMQMHMMGTKEDTMSHAVMDMSDEAHPSAHADSKKEQPAMDMSSIGQMAEHGSEHSMVSAMDETAHNELLTEHEQDEHQTALPRHAGEGGRQARKPSLFLADDIASAENLAMDGMTERPWPPYENLRSIQKTVFDPQKAVREIRLTLDGDMERYVWFFNNKALSETDSIRIKEGEVVRFILVNRTMMHHPIHLHGHFFRVINAHGDYSPLKHTVDAAPMSTTVIEFSASEIGDWFFHCHLLYHMKAGMSRVVHYEEFSPSMDVERVRHRLYRENWYFWARADLLSNMSEGVLALADTRNSIEADWEIGWEEVEKNEWDGTLTWGRYINRFFSLFAGGFAQGEADHTEHVRALAGMHYLLPLNIESTVWGDSDGGMRIIFDKEIELTPRLKIGGEFEYDTHKTAWETKATLSFQLAKRLSLLGQWHSEFDWGVGLRMNF